MLHDNLRRIRDEIALACRDAGRSPLTVGIMAVTKTHPSRAILEAVAAGVDLIGENRVTEGGRKIRELGRETARFHLIGPLHVKEVRQAVRDFHCIEAVDRMAVVREIARRKPDMPVLLEVNTSGESSKKGFPPDSAQLEEVLGETTALGLTVQGLMTVGPLSGGREASRIAFRALRLLRDRLRGSTGIPLDALSMGMSDDFADAVREGATTVRLGRALFGERR